MKKQLTKNELDKVWQFASGQKNCLKNRQAKTGQTQSYYDGYGFEYGTAECKSAQARWELS